MPGVTICVPHGSDADIREWKNYFEDLKRKGYGYMESRSYGVTQCRNMLVESALTTTNEWIFWLDDDNVGTPDAIEKLLSAATANNIPILSGIYMAKKKIAERGIAAWIKQNGSNIVSPWEVSKQTGYASINIQQPGRYISVDVIGLGCCLMHRSVLEKMPKPWFRWDDPHAQSEDFDFLQRVATTLNIKPVVDMECQFDHIGRFRMNVKNEFEALGA